MQVELKKSAAIAEAISRINLRAFDDVYLIPNPVLERNNLASNFLDDYLSDRDLKPVSERSIAKWIVSSWKVHGYWFARFLVKSIVFRWLCGKGVAVKKDAELLMLDSYIDLENIAESGALVDRFLGSIAKVFDERGMSYAAVPLFLRGSNLRIIAKSFRALAASQKPIMSEYSLFTAGDFAACGAFILLYPFRVWKLARSLGASREEMAIKNNLYESLKSQSIQAYVRYLLGRKVGQLTSQRIRCISWFENQSVQKLFYRGLRESNRNVEVVGVHTLISSPSVLFLRIDEGEASLGLLPDAIFYNGKNYLVSHRSITSKIGPSLRYKHIFGAPSGEPAGKCVLFVFPYGDHEAENLLEIAKEVHNEHVVVVKPHPGCSKWARRRIAESGIRVDGGSLESLLKIASVVAGGSTGALFEAAACGKPVVYIDSPNRYCHNYLPELGEGIIWRRARSVWEAKAHIREFLSVSAKDSESIHQVSEAYVRDWFCEPSEERIISDFVAEHPSPHGTKANETTS